MKNFLILFLLSLGAPISGFSSVTAVGDTIVIEGRILDETADQFVDAAYGKEIRQIIFRNSTGGQWRAGQRLANLIIGRNLTTVVEGYCASACATAFLAGEERLFSGATPSPLLAIHLPYLNSDLTNIQNHADFSIAWFEKRTKRPLPAQIKAALFAGKPPTGGIFFLAEDDPEVAKYGGLTMLCKGDEPRPPWDCKKDETISAFRLGFLTKSERYRAVPKNTPQTAP